jgi:hypothetical protein
VAQHRGGGAFSLHGMHVLHATMTALCVLRLSFCGAAGLRKAVPGLEVSGVQCVVITSLYQLPQLGNRQSGCTVEAGEQPSWVQMPPMCSYDANKKGVGGECGDCAMRGTLPGRVPWLIASEWPVAAFVALWQALLLYRSWHGAACGNQWLTTSALSLTCLWKWEGRLCACCVLCPACICRARLGAWRGHCLSVCCDHAVGTDQLVWPSMCVGGRSCGAATHPECSGVVSCGDDRQVGAARVLVAVG